MSIRVTLIPGDGIGPEVTEAAKSVILASGAPIEWEIVEAGEHCIEQYGTPLPEHVLERIRVNKVALKGPITSSVGTNFQSVNIGLRQALNLYANVRPMRSVRHVSSRYPNVDMVIVRENTEDLYSGIEHKRGDNAAEGLKIITREASERIGRHAFELARRERRHKVTVVHKANILKETDGLFLESVQAVAQEYPDIECEDKNIDALCMEMVLKPEQFDVLVLPNLYGDIVSGLGAGLIGGLGLAPGANIGLEGAIFEAAHGTAPDLAGKDAANPLALILSGVEMLKYLSLIDEACRIEKAIDEVLADQNNWTRDLGGMAGTREITSEIIKAMKIRL